MFNTCAYLQHIGVHRGDFKYRFYFRLHFLSKPLLILLLKFHEKLGNVKIL